MVFTSLVRVCRIQDQLEQDFFDPEANLALLKSPAQTVSTRGVCFFGGPAGGWTSGCLRNSRILRSQCITRFTIFGGEGFQQIESSLHFFKVRDRLLLRPLPKNGSNPLWMMQSGIARVSCLPIGSPFLGLTELQLLSQAEQKSVSERGCISSILRRPASPRSRGSC